MARQDQQESGGRPWAGDWLVCSRKVRAVGDNLRMTLWGLQHPWRCSSPEISPPPRGSQPEVLPATLALAFSLPLQCHLSRCKGLSYSFFKKENGLLRTS